MLLIHQPMADRVLNLSHSINCISSADHHYTDHADGARVYLKHLQEL
jgi:hypothetical protein